jgi:hypothetical protein
VFAPEPSTPAAIKVKLGAKCAHALSPKTQKPNCTEIPRRPSPQSEPGRGSKPPAVPRIIVGPSFTPFESVVQLEPRGFRLSRYLPITAHSDDRKSTPAELSYQLHASDVEARITIRRTAELGNAPTEEACTLVTRIAPGNLDARPT